jgi:hypothetical protein
MSHPALSDLVDELSGLSTAELHQLARAIEREIEARQRQRKLL